MNWKNIFGTGKSVCAVSVLSAICCLGVHSAQAAKISWTNTQPTATAGLLSTDGTLVYAYAPNAITLDGISFTADPEVTSGDFSFNPVIDSVQSGLGGADQSGDWATAMKTGWAWKGAVSSVEVTLNGLTMNRRCLVQVLSHNGWSSVEIGTAKDDLLLSKENLGVSLVGEFISDSTKQAFTLYYDGDGGWRSVNVFMVRDLGPAPEPPAGTRKLTIPPKDGLVIESVKTNGIDVASYGTVYGVFPGAEVTITFAAATGYEITGGNPVVKTITADTTLADAEYPTFEERLDGDARYSLDGGESWTLSSTMQGAIDAVSAQTKPGIIEVIRDCTFWSCTASQGDITVRSKNAATIHKVTCNNNLRYAWQIPAGFKLVLSNVVMSAGSRVCYDALFDVAAGSTLELGYGCRVTTGITSGSAGYAVINKGTVNFEGGVISGWRVTGNNAPVAVTAATGRVNIHDGGIENCTASGLNGYGGSAISGQNNNFSTATEPVFTMTGGFIRNITQETESVVKFNWGGLKISITGGAITNNTGTSSDNYEAIYIGGGTMLVGGDAIVCDNFNGAGEQRNFYVVGTASLLGKQVQQVSNLTDGAKVGVYSTERKTEGAVFGTATEGLTGAEHFVNDLDTALTGLLEGTDLKWFNASIVYVRLTVPDKEGLAEPTVTAPVGLVSKVSPGVWKVPAETEVTLTYTAATGYKIVSGNPVKVAMGTVDKTLTVEDLPTVGYDGTARYSIDGGKSWTIVSNVDAALAAVKSLTEDVVVEALEDGNFLGRPLGAQGYYGFQCNITLRSIAGKTCTLTCNNGDGMGGLVVPDGKSVTFSNVVIYAGSVKSTGFLRTDSGSTTAELHFGPGSVVTSAANPAGKCILFAGKVYFDGGVLSGWKSSSPIISVQGSHDFCLEINDGGIENCSADGSGSGILYGWNVNADHVFFRMNGGFVRNNTMSSSCPTMIGARKGNILLAGGVVTNNVCDNCVFKGLSSSDFKINVSGNPVVYNNHSISGSEQKNIYVKNKYCFTQVGTLTAGAMLGVYANGLGAAGNIFGTRTDTSYMGASYIINDQNPAMCGLCDGLNLKWMEGAVRLTVPSKEGLAKPTVTASFGEPREVEEGVWEAAKNSLVTLSYTALPGYRITGGNPVQVQLADSDVALPVTSLPTVLKQIVLTIPEKEELEFVSIAGGNVSEIVAGSTYYVDPSSKVTISFKATFWYEIVSGNPVIYNVGATDTVLDQFPVVKRRSVAPEIGGMSLTVNGSTVAVSLTDVLMGTDTEGEPATEYTINWRVSGATERSGTVPGQTGVSAAFDITALANGDYDLTVTITTDKARTSAEKTAAFSVFSFNPDDYAYAFDLELGDAMKTALAGYVENGYPLLVRISESRVPGFKYDDLKHDDLSDLVFADAAGNILFREVETWNPGGESLVWVRVPQLKADTKISCYYCGVVTPQAPTNVWSGYKGVWHFDEDKGNAGDSAGNGLDAVPSKNASYTGDPLKEMIGEAGVLGQARLGGVTPGGKGTYMSVPAYTLTDDAVFTVSGWYKLRGLHSESYPRFVSSKLSYKDPDGFEVMAVADGSTELKIRGSDEGTAFTATVPDYLADWVKMTFVYSGANVTVYANGALVTTGKVSPVEFKEKLAIGGTSDGADWSWYGWYDEVRLYDGELAARRVKLEYLNESQADSVVVGAVKPLDKTMPKLNTPVVTGNDDGTYTVTVLVEENMPMEDMTRLTFRGQTYLMSTEDLTVPATFAATFTTTARQITETGMVIARSTAGNDCRVSTPSIYTGTLAIEKVKDAAEMGQVEGLVRITRADADHDLVIRPAALESSTAVEGVNYVALQETVTILAGNTSATFPVKPLVDISKSEDTYVDVGLAPGPYAPIASRARVVIVSLPSDNNFWCATAAGKSSVAANWTLGSVPGEGESVFFDGGLSKVDCEWDTSVSIDTLKLSSGYSGTISLAVDLKLQTLDASDKSAVIDLKGHTLSIRRASLGGTKVPAGSYTPGQSPFGTMLVDSVGGGVLKVSGSGFRVLFK